MKKDRYEIKADTSLFVFEFVSKGPKGEIVKLVQYSETNFVGIYNLGFGDKNERTSDADDHVITNNGDSQKVLATVATTVYAFLDKHPKAWIYATGSNNIRTRLYRIGITNNLAEITRDFEVFGLANNAWYPFEKGVEYEAFLLKKK